MNTTLLLKKPIHTPPETIKIIINDINTIILSLSITLGKHSAVFKNFSLLTVKKCMQHKHKFEVEVKLGKQYKKNTIILPSLILMVCK